MPTKQILIAFAVVAAFLTGLYAERYFLDQGEPAHGGSDPSAERATEYYTCPMHPHIHEGEAGDCPICGMSLVEKQHERSASPAMRHERPEIFVEPQVIHNFGIKTETLGKGNISRPVRLYGYVSKVESPQPTQIISPVSGRVVAVKPVDNGRKYLKNEVLIELESPAIEGLQQQYLDAVAANEVKRLRILKQKLMDLGFGLDELKQLVETRKPTKTYRIYAPNTGRLTTLSVQPEQQVLADALLAEFNPMYSVTAVAQVFETQWIWLKSGQTVTMTSRSYPGTVWHGEVRQVNELGQSSTTAVKMTAEFESAEDVAAKLGMQAKLTVSTDSRRDVLLAPSSAVIYTGSKCVVVVSKGDGHFQPVDVTVGLNNGERTEILSGLKEGMRVVVSGQFLLDSESELNAELARLQPNDRDN